MVFEFSCNNMGKRSKEPLWTNSNITASLAPHAFHSFSDLPLPACSDSHTRTYIIIQKELSPQTPHILSCATHHYRKVLKQRKSRRLRLPLTTNLLSQRRSS